MGEVTVMSKNQDLITINQKILLPETYKKFSTIKLRIRPAKLIFVGSGSDSNHDQKHFSNFPAAQNGENKEENYGNEQVIGENFRLDPSYLFSSAESLSVFKDEKEKGYISTNLKMNHRELHCGTEYQMTQMGLKTNEDCEIVKELVLEKFKDLLEKFIEKSNSRKIFSMDQEENVRGWNEYENIHVLDPFIFHLQQEVNQELQLPENKRISQTMKKLETDNTRATSYDLCNNNYDHENIMKQNKETMLESQNPSSDPFPRREYHPNYVHISEQMETVQSLQHIERKTETVENQSTVTFPHEDESDDRRCNYFENKLKDELNEQASAIIQVLKILHMCERDKKLSDSVLRVEAERVLLIATLRREILNMALTTSDFIDEDDKNGFVLVSGLRIPLEQILEKKPKQTRFFICILRCGTSVFCSDLLVPNSNTELFVGDPFCFEELRTDFKISVEIYTMDLKIREKSSGMKILKKYRNFFLGWRSRFRNTAEANPREISTTRKSAFTCIGRTVISRSELQLRELSLENVNPDNFPQYKLKYNIASGVKLDIFLSGFLMVCESCSGKTRWRRQWCILDASELKFWDYPGREETTEPNIIIDLSRSLLPYIMLADRKFCSRPRSLHLKIGPDSAQEEFYHKDIFLAADNPRDFLFWEKELNRVLKNLINWGCMKTYFENSL